MVVVKNKLPVNCLRPGSDVSEDWVFRGMNDAGDLEEETRWQRCCNFQSCLGRTRLCRSMCGLTAAQLIMGCLLFWTPVVCKTSAQATWQQSARGSSPAPSDLP